MGWPHAITLAYLGYAFLVVLIPLGVAFFGPSKLHLEVNKGLGYSDCPVHVGYLISIIISALPNFATHP